MANALTTANQQRRWVDPQQSPEGFVFRWPGQIELPSNVRPYGACEPWEQMQTMRQVGEPFRYSLGLVPLTATAGTAITLTAGVPGPNGVVLTTLFDYGQGQPIEENGAALGTLIETDADKDGAPIKLGMKFYAMAMSVNLMQPFLVVNGTGGGYTRSYPAWLRNGYSDALRQTFMDGVAFRFRFGDQACQYDMGNPSQWPQPGGASGGSVVRNGAGFGAGQIMPFRRMFELGARDESDQMTVQVIGGPGLSVGNDAANAIPSDITGLVMPIQVTIFGFPVPDLCVPCAVAGASASGGLDYNILMQSDEGRALIAARIAAQR